MLVAARHSRCLLPTPVRPTMVLVAAWFGTPMPDSLVAQAEVAQIQVSPDTLTLRVGERGLVSAQARDRSGSVLTGVEVIWVSRNASIASVDARGYVTGVGSGTVEVVARVGNREGSAVVVVRAGAGAVPPRPAARPAGPRLTSLQVEPRTIYLLPSEQARLVAVGYREGFESVGPVGATWRSVEPRVAAMQGDGNVIGVAAGTTTVTATGPGGLVATASVEVHQADVTFAAGDAIWVSVGQSDTLRVVVPAQAGRPVPGERFAWTTSDPAIAVVSPVGIVTGLRPGRATVTAEAFRQRRSLTVSVHRAVSTLVAAPRDSLVLLPLGGRQRFIASALAADGSPVPEAPLRWTVEDSGVVSLDASGEGLGRRMGSSRVSVRAPGELTKQWLVRVIPADLRLSPVRIGLGRGQSVGVTASFVDDRGAAIGQASGLAWTSDRDTVVRVIPGGALTGVGYGRATVTATTTWGKSASVEVYVIPEILVASNRGGGRYALFGFERGAPSLQLRIGPDTLGLVEAAFAPDATRLAVVGTRAGNAELYVVDADGGRAARLTHDPGADARPQWSPDGATIVLHSNRSGANQIYVSDAAGRSLRQLTSGEAENRDPTVSPDGSILAFTSARDRNYEIYLADLDGSKQRNLTRSPGIKEARPRFLKDGTLAYLQERREGERIVWQVMRHDLVNGTVRPMSVANPLILDFAISSSADLLALVVARQGTGERGPVTYEVLLQSPGATATPVAVPAPAGSSTLAPAFRP